MKRKRSEWDAQSPCNPTRQKYFESPYAQSPATREASLPSTKRTPPIPCSQHCAERCSRASPTPSPSPPQKRRALSLNPPTPPKRSHRSTSRRLQNASPQTGGLQHDYNPSGLPLTKENLRALEPILSLAEEASPMSTPRNPSPTRMESVRTHMKRLAGYNITFDRGTPFPDALAQFVEALGMPREEAPSPHAQAVIDTRRAAAMENESTGRKMMEGHLLFYGEGHAGGIPGLTLKDQVNLNKDHLPSPPRSTVPELWGTLPRNRVEMRFQRVVGQVCFERPCRY